MFSRPNNNYDVPNDVILSITKDRAHPIAHIIDYIQNGQTILDIGAGSGVLARALLQSGKKVSIDAIEPNPYAARIASPLYREMLCGYVQEFYAEIAAKNYDVIILADVVEHIPDPFSMLKNLLDNLNPHTKLLISIPNVSFGGVRIALLNGKFTYTDSGLLEKTHLRFFTRRTADQMFERLQLITEKTWSLERSFYRTEFSRADLSTSFLNILRLCLISDARAYQYLYLVSKRKGLAIKSSEINHCGANSFVILRDYFFHHSFFVKILSSLLKLIKKI